MDHLPTKSVKPPVMATTKDGDLFKEGIDCPRRFYSKEEREREREREREALVEKLVEVLKNRGNKKEMSNLLFKFNLIKYHDYVTLS